MSQSGVLYLPVKDRTHTGNFLVILWRSPPIIGYSYCVLQHYVLCSTSFFLVLLVGVVRPCCSYSLPTVQVYLHRESSVLAVDKFPRMSEQLITRRKINFIKNTLIKLMRFPQDFIQMSFVLVWVGHWY